MSDKLIIEGETVISAVAYEGEILYIGEDEFNEVLRPFVKEYKSFNQYGEATYELGKLRITIERIE